MARVTHVKKAQQRYKTKDVIDPATGQVKKTPVMKGDKQKTTKKGKLVFMTVTERDLTQPLPPYECDAGAACKHESRTIEIGTPYKHITPKSGPYGGRKRTRHADCPTWQVWEYSNSLGARLSQISYDFDQAVDQAESPDDITSALSDAASSINEIAEEKKESASNIEEGFGHPTSASEELESVADQLESWASEVESADVPDMTACEECDDGQLDCDGCDGTGQVDDEETGDIPVDGKQVPCEDCSGTGTVDCTNCDGTAEDISAWRDEVRDNVTIVDESPV